MSEIASIIEYRKGDLGWILDMLQPYISDFVKKNSASTIDEEINSFIENMLMPNIKTMTINGRESIVKTVKFVMWYKLNSTMEASTTSTMDTREANEHESDVILSRLFGKSMPIAAMAPTARAIEACTPDVEEKKWRLQTEVIKLFSDALKAAFPDFEEKCCWLWSKEYGDFHCDNVLSIWPKIKEERASSNPRNSYLHIVGPKDVGVRIRDGLISLKSCMIEGEPNVFDVGFVTIKLSGKWMAEKIHKMLRDGIDTWAPRQQDDIRSFIINTPSWDASQLTPMDVLRREFIIMAQMNMVEYVQAAVKTSSGNHMSLTRERLDKYFRAEEKKGDVVIFSKDGGKRKSLIRGKIRGKSCGERDGRCGYPLEDLGALWHGFVEEEADWIVSVTPAQQEEYIENCFNAAVDAGWITTETFFPEGTYAGFRTCSTSLEALLSFLSSLETTLEADEAFEVLEYTDEAILDCALTYAFLKKHRLADFTISYNEIFAKKGDTFLYLLATLAEIHKITICFLNEIRELKASNLVLGDKVVWCEGVERELAFHLLMFTEHVNDSCMSFLPHNLCRYLYNLCEKFNCFYETYASSGFEETTRLLLCEATAIVMEKGFHLLGITPKPSLEAVSLAVALNFVAPSQAIRTNPHKNQHTNSRFEVFNVYVDVSSADFRRGKLFGDIMISDSLGLVPDGWGQIDKPGPGRVTLFDRHWFHAIDITNPGRLTIGNPRSRRSVPFASSMEIGMTLYATTEDEIFEVCAHHSNDFGFKNFWNMDSKSSCQYIEVGGADGFARMHYILLKDAVDASIRVKYVGSKRKFNAELLAYYGSDFDYGDDALAASFYKASLLESYGESLKGDVALIRSCISVPTEGSLIIAARFTDAESGEVVFHGKCEFSSHHEDTFAKHITKHKKDAKDQNDDHLEVIVSWSQG